MGVALLAAVAAEGGEAAAENEDLVPWPPYVYGGIAFVTFMVLLLVVTRLNIDR